MDNFSFNQLLRKGNESAFDYLNRGVPYYQSIRYGKPLDRGYDLSKSLSPVQKNAIEVEVCKNLMEAVRVQCAQKASKLAGIGDFDEFCANGVVECLDHIEKYNPDIAGFYSFMKPYINRALSETIEQYSDLSRNEQMYVKRLKMVINDLSIRFEVPAEMIRQVDIAFELKKYGESDSLEKINDFWKFIDFRNEYDEYNPDVHCPDEFIEEFDFSSVVYDEILAIIIDFFSAFNEVDKFLYYSRFFAAYDGKKRKDFALDPLFIRVCAADSVSSKHIYDTERLEEHIENRNKYINKRLNKLFEYLSKEEYVEEALELWDAILTEEAGEFFFEMAEKYNVTVNVLKR